MTLVTHLHHRAQQTPAEAVTLGELDTRASAIAAVLQAHCSQGDRVLLVYPKGLEAIATDTGMKWLFNSYCRVTTTRQ